MGTANKNPAEAYSVSVRIQVDPSGKNGELVYSLKNESELKTFLEHHSTIKAAAQLTKKQHKLSKIFCSFSLGSYIPSLELQKKLIVFQKDIFDEVLVQIFKNYLENPKEFEILSDYATKITNKNVRIRNSF